MQAWEITSEAAATLGKPRTPAQQRVHQLNQQVKQAQQQAKREKANTQLQKARQAVADANKQLPTTK